MSVQQRRNSFKEMCDKYGVPVDSIHTDFTCIWWVFCV